jgi:hypothetical protein
VCAAAFAALGAGPGGCGDQGPGKAYVALSPVATMVSPSEVRTAAEYCARLRPGAFVLVGDGNGMMPLYPSGSALVVEPKPFSELKEGMTVALMNRQGQRMCHFLIAYGVNGWVTRGLNEKQDDEDPLTAANYVGVVIMAFSPATGG